MNLKLLTSLDYHVFKITKKGSIYVQSYDYEVYIRTVLTRNYRIMSHVHHL